MSEDPPNEMSVEKDDVTPSIHPGAAESAPEQDKPITVRQRSPEWVFFKDEGSWKATTYRRAKCQYCSTIKRSKRETLYNHILTCESIPKTEKDAYLVSDIAFRPNKENIDSAALKTNDQTILQNRHKVHKNQIKLEDQLLLTAISMNWSFLTMENFWFLSALRELYINIHLPNANISVTTVLNRVHTNMLKKFQDAYQSGVHITIGMNGWKTDKHDKWVGFCRQFQSGADPKYCVDLTKFVNISCGTRLKEDTIMNEINTEIRQFNGVHKNYENTSVVGIVINSDACDMATRMKLEETHKNISFVSCFANQLNLIAATVLSHFSTKHVMADVNAIVDFFMNHSSHRSILQARMNQIFQTKVEFVKHDETKWSSLFVMVLTLYRFRKAFEAYQSNLALSDPILRNAKAISVIRCLGDVLFWKKLGMLSTLLQPITREILKIESQNCTLSDVTQAFGRLWALFTLLQKEEFGHYDLFENLLSDLLKHLDWRLNLYYDIDLLLTAHILDPSVKLSGLNTAGGKDYKPIEYVLRSRFAHLKRTTFSAKPDAKITFKVECRDWIHGKKTVEVCKDGLKESWNNTANFDGNSLLRKVAVSVLSIAPTVANLKKVWSSTESKCSTRRPRISKGNMFRKLQISAQICEEEVQRRIEQNTLATTTETNTGLNSNNVTNSFRRGSVGALASVQKETSQLCLRTSDDDSEDRLFYSSDEEESADEGEEIPSAINSIYKDTETQLLEENLTALAEQFLDIRLVSRATADSSSTDGLQTDEISGDPDPNSSNGDDENIEVNGEPVRKKQRVCYGQKRIEFCRDIFNYDEYLEKATAFYDIVRGNASFSAL